MHYYVYDKIRTCYFEIQSGQLSKIPEDAESAGRILVQAGVRDDDEGVMREEGGDCGTGTRRGRDL
jgi:hypothetical protein